MTKIIFRYTFIFNIGQNLEQDKILELFKSTVSIFVPCIILLHVHHMINYVGNIKNLFIDYYLKFSNKKKFQSSFLKNNIYIMIQLLNLYLSYFLHTQHRSTCIPKSVSRTHSTFGRK